MIREFKADDAAHCCEIINENLMKMSDYPLELREYFCQKNTPQNLTAELVGFAKAVVFVKGKRIVGLGALDGAVIKKVYVDPSEHGDGIGSSIMDALEENAKGKGLRAVGVGSSVTAESFYRCRGYRTMKRCNVDVQGMHMPSIEMEKEL